ncbi:MAG TPA: type II toxin-antitoxin system Phd/YefM family antitoxin [Actinokineospora sp.]|nr:type II toxin-antitoxin system Phd/YefM family antitoxin [Actinokineospora sp.]
MSEHARWQVQEAKQRFSEVLRAVEREGPQTITRHGEDVAVLIDIQEYRRLSGRGGDFVSHLMAFPKIDDQPGEVDVFDEIEAERKNDLPRPTDFEIELGLTDSAAQ